MRLTSTTMLHRVNEGRIVIASNRGEESFSFDAGDFAHIAYVCGDDQSQSVVVTAAQTAEDTADIRASVNQRGNYRAYRITGSGSELLTNEYTNTATPLPDGSICYSNGANLVLLSTSGRRTWKVGRFNYGPVSISCNRDQSVIAMTKWKGDDRRLLTVNLADDSTEVSKFSYYSYVLNGSDVYYTHASSVKGVSLTSGEGETLTKKTFEKAVLSVFGVPPQEVRLNFKSLKLFEGRLLAEILVLDDPVSKRLAYGAVSWTPGEADPRVELDAGKDGKILNIASNGETAVVYYHSAGDDPKSAARVLSMGRSSAWIDAGWHLVGAPWIPDHGFQFLPRPAKV